MKKILLSALLCSVPQYIIGDAPWCTATEGGDLGCYYYVYGDCMRAVRQSAGTWVACVANPNGGD